MTLWAYNIVSSVTRLHDIPVALSSHTECSWFEKSHWLYFTARNQLRLVKKISGPQSVHFQISSKQLEISLTALKTNKCKSLYISKYIIIGSFPNKHILDRPTTLSFSSRSEFLHKFCFQKSKPGSV